MGQTREQRVIRSVVGVPTNQKFTPIATDMFLPNHSGIKSHPEMKQLIPTGVVQMWTTNTAPNGWLICDGSAISRIDYSALFAVIGTAFGVGNGTTTFNIPNLKNKFPVGKDSSVSAIDTIGETGGYLSHAHFYTGSFSGGGNTGTPSATTPNAQPYSSGSPVVGASSTHTHSFSFGGGFGGMTSDTETTGHSSIILRPPYITLNFIIKV